MALKFRKKILLAKIETVYGTDSVPTGAANAIVTKDLEISPMEGDLVNRDVDRPTLGNDLSIHVGTHVMATFKVEMAGSGVVDTPVAYGPLLRACGRAETANAAVSVDYDLISGSEESVTIHMHFDGQRHAMVGCRGDVGITIDPKGIPYWNFSITGLWVDPSAVADPVPDFTAFQIPLAVTNDNTPTFTLYGNAFNLLGLNLNQANQVVYRNVVGEESVQITDRAPAGNVTIEAPPLGTWNAFTVAKANATGALSVIHGTVAGNIIEHACPTVQITNPRYGESDGIRTLQMDLAMIPSSAGDDEWVITTR